jgi:hypothetical protein
MLRASKSMSLDIFIHGGARLAPPSARWFPGMFLSCKSECTMPRDDGSYPPLDPLFQSASHTRPSIPSCDCPCLRPETEKGGPFLSTWYVRPYVGGDHEAGARWRDSLWRLWNAVFYQLDAVALCAVRQRSMDIFMFFSASSQLGVQAAAAVFDYPE